MQQRTIMTSGLTLSPPADDEPQECIKLHHSSTNQTIFIKPSELASWLYAIQVTDFIVHCYSDLKITIIARNEVCIEANGSQLILPPNEAACFVKEVMQGGYNNLIASLWNQ
jgi:hypothetical protein